MRHAHEQPPVGSCNNKCIYSVFRQSSWKLAFYIHEDEFFDFSNIGTVKATPLHLPSAMWSVVILSPTVYPVPLFINTMLQWVIDWQLDIGTLCNLCFLCFAIRQWSLESSMVKTGSCSSYSRYVDQQSQPYSALAAAVLTRQTLPRFTASLPALP